jgi:hypothetical protein
LPQAWLPQAWLPRVSSQQAQAPPSARVLHLQVRVSLPPAKLRARASPRASQALPELRGRRRPPALAPKRPKQKW